MRDIFFWGATGQAKVLNDLIHDFDFSLIALIDNRNISSPIKNIPIFLGEKGFRKFIEDRGGVKNLSCAVSIGGDQGRDRLTILNMLKNYGIKIENLIHKTAFVAHDVVFGFGNQFLAQSALCANCEIGSGVIINTCASVDHDCKIGDGVHLAPGARVAGQVTIGNFVFVGTGAVILPNIKIGDNAIIGAGSVVTRDVESGETVMGNPARIKNNKYIGLNI